MFKRNKKLKFKKKKLLKFNKIYKIFNKIIIQILDLIMI